MRNGCDSDSRCGLACDASTRDTKSLAMWVERCEPLRFGPRIPFCAADALWGGVTHTSDQISKHCGQCSWVAIEVAIYRMGNGPGAQIPEKWKENGKWPHARNGREMAAEMEKWTPKWDFGLILAIFSISAAIFRPFRAWGHFPFSFPFFRDFCSGPVSHSVNGHFNRNSWV